MMRKLMLMGVLSLIFASQISQAQVVDENTDALILGNINFGFDLYQTLQADASGNLMISPYSISQALAMTYAGAGSTTATEMADTLHFTLPQADLHPTFAALTDRVTAIPPAGVPENDELGFKLKVANALWGQAGLPFSSTFLTTVDQNYGAGFQQVDFAEPVPAAEQINAWVAEQTEDKIPTLIQPNMIDAGTALVLTNAIYFKASWDIPFEADFTEAADFTRLDNSTVPAFLMRRTDYFLYMDAPEYQAVSLPYYGDKIHMLVILPEAGAFEDVEAALDGDMYGLIWRSLSSNQVRLALPRFTAEYEISLVDGLQSLGMTAAFNADAADFTGIAPADIPLFISEVLHKTFISVDEKGTEAAAATAVMVAVGGAQQTTEPIIFRADRPFIYAIYDRDTGTILFLGRVVDPT